MVIVLLAKMGIIRFQSLLRILLWIYLTSHWNNRDKISTNRVSTLFISGLNDELIPPSQMIELHDRAKACGKYFLGVKGGEHNDTYIHGGQLYYENISQFISRLLP